MTTKTWLAFSAVLVFLAGWCFGNQQALRAQSTARVFESRTYTANEGKLPALNAMFKNHVVKLLEKQGMQSIGYWTPTDAPLSQSTLIYIVAHASRDAARKSWDAFRNDPEWKKTQQEADADGRVVGMVESVFAEPTDFSPVR